MTQKDFENPNYQNGFNNNIDNICMINTAEFEKSQKEGAHHSYLQVVQTNDIAVNLYKKLGFEKLYSYWYMKKNQ